MSITKKPKINMIWYGNHNSKEFKVMAKKAIKWIEALKSGKFKKGIDQLGTQDVKGNWSYCCLGVGCKVLNVDVDYKAALSDALVKEIGLVDPAGIYGGAYSLEGKSINKALGTLAKDNDGKYRNDKDFKNMVELIMNNLDTIFIKPVGDLIMEHYNVKGH